MKNHKRAITVSVPSTTANLGPGFDVLGAALDIRNEVTFYPGQPFQMKIYGEGSKTLPRTKENLIYRSYERVFNIHKEKLIEGTFVIKNRIPLSRGLGSSAAATLLGAGIAAALLELPEEKSIETILKVGEEFEGHPDNIIPAFFGGIQLCVKEKKETKNFPLPVPENTSVLLVVPRKKISTAKARKILSKKIEMEKAVFNISRTALLVWSLDRKDLSGWKEASRDSIHQEKRMNLVNGLSDIFREIYSSELCISGWLSGSGSTLAFVALDSDLKDFENYVNRVISKKRFDARITLTRFSEKGMDLRYE
jgi:homoserine kinase